jgi:hypothetical protein
MHKSITVKMRNENVLIDNNNNLILKSLPTISQSTNLELDLSGKSLQIGEKKIDSGNLPYFLSRLATARMCQAARGLARGLISHRDNVSNNCAIVSLVLFLLPSPITAAWSEVARGNRSV